MYFCINVNIFVSY